MVLGELEATVVDVKPFDLHGVTYYDVAIRYADGVNVEQARLGPEGVPDGLRPGEHDPLAGHGPTRLGVGRYDRADPAPGAVARTSH